LNHNSWLVFHCSYHCSSCPFTTPATPGTTARINGHKSTEQQQQQQQQQQKQQPAQQTFTILIAIEKSQHLCVIDLICQSLRLLAKQIGNCEILAVCPDSSLLQLCNGQQQQKLQQQQQQNNNSDHPVSLKFIPPDLSDCTKGSQRKMI